MICIKDSNTDARDIRRHEEHEALTTKNYQPSLIAMDFQRVLQLNIQETRRSTLQKNLQSKGVT